MDYMLDGSMVRRYICGQWRPYGVNPLVIQPRNPEEQKSYALRVIFGDVQHEPVKNMLFFVALRKNG